MPRRWITLVLLCWMPLLHSYAVAAGYCEHEAGTAAHFGHHEHPHGTVTLADDNGAGNDAFTLNPGGIDFDCGHSHVVQAGVLPSLAPLATLAPREKAPRTLDNPQTSSVPDALERVPLATPLAFA